MRRPGRPRALLLCVALLAGCAASRSPLTGAFARPAEPNLGAEPVSVLFVFRHEKQRHGFDTITKLQYSGVTDFDDLFRDALGEISNVSRYETFSELPSDVNKPERREQLVAARAAFDYVIEIEFLEESSFKEQFLSGTIATLSMTLIPVPFDWDYTISATVARKGGTRVAQYQRKATLSNWLQAFLIFVYPFHPLEGKREAIISESLHDILREIEAAKVLRP